MWDADRSGKLSSEGLLESGRCIVSGGKSLPNHYLLGELCQAITGGFIALAHMAITRQNR